MRNFRIASLTMAYCMLHGLSPALSPAAEPVLAARGTGASRPQQPQLAVDKDGAVHLVYGVGESVRYHRSNDGGKSFAAPTEIPLAPALALGMRRGPRIATADSSICIAAIGGREGKGRDGDVLAVRSDDGGKSWSIPLRVNDAENSAREGLHALAGGPSGDLCCVWLDLRHNQTEVVAATSSDGGKNWTPNVLVYQSPDGSVCECCHPSVAFDDHGKIFVQWRNSLGGRRDIYFAVSSDGGRKFSKAIRLDSQGWTLDACPMDGGAIAVAGTQATSVWRRKGSIYVATLKQRTERLLGDGEQPWIAATTDGPYLVWLKKRGAEAYVLAPRNNQPIILAPHAYDPVIAAGSAIGGPVVAAWEVRNGPESSIWCSVVSEDNSSR